MLRENGKVHTTVKKNNIHDKYEYIFTYSDHLVTEMCVKFDPRHPQPTPQNEPHPTLKTNKRSKQDSLRNLHESVLSRQ